jgi:hypothetical protein
VKSVKSATAALLAVIVAGLALPAAADPPSHAPAHGWRKKNDPYYVGYTGRHWADDYGVREGRCDRDRAGAAIGAVVGGAIGAAVSDGDDRLIAILAGATIGASATRSSCSRTATRSSGPARRAACRTR